MDPTIRKNEKTMATHNSTPYINKEKLRKEMKQKHTNEVGQGHDELWFQNWDY